MKKYFERLSILLLLLCASGAGAGIYMGQQTANSGDPGGSTGLQILYALFYLLICLWLLPWHKQALSLLFEEKWMLLLLLLAVASTFWSVDSGETFRRSLGLAGSTITGLFIAMRYEPKQQIRILAACIVVAAVASLVVGFVLPGIGLMPDGAWRGVFYLKNGLGRMMSLGVVCFAFLAIGQRQFRTLAIAMIALCGILLLLAKSATGIVVCGIVLALLPFRSILNRSKRRIVALSVILAIVLLPAAHFAWNRRGRILASMGRESSLTGRLPLWEAVGTEISYKPLLGSGYTAFWSTADAERYRQASGWDAPNAHNGFLEMALGLGFIGLAVFAIGMFRNFTRAIVTAARSEEIETAWPLFFLIFCVLYNLTESTLFSGNSIFWILYTASAYWLVRATAESRVSNVVESEPHPSPAGIAEPVTVE